MILLLILVVWFLGIILLAPYANSIGRAIDNWLNIHFPNIEE